MTCPCRGVNYSARAALCAGLELAYNVSADKIVTQSTDTGLGVA